MANIDDLDEDFILCNVCNNEYDEDQRAPKLLPCLHTLCNDCALNAAQGSVLKCSICQEEHPLSSDLQFLKDCTMKNMVDMIKIQRKSSSILCSDCPDDNQGEGFCKDCYVFLCTECTSAHKRTQVTRRHTILSLEELKNSGIGSFSKKEMCQIPGHEEQPFSFYCESEECQKPVCTQCVVGDHSQANGHVIRNLNEVFEENKLLVERCVGELLTKISEVSSDAKLLEGESSTIEEKQTEMNKEVDALFDDLEAMVQKRREQLKERVDVICQERKNLISEELATLQKNKTDMENSCNYSSRMLVFTNKPEFLNLKNVVVSKLNTLVNAEIDTARPEPMDLTFEPCLDQDKFGDIVNSIGEVKTNIYGEVEKSVPKTNGTTHTIDQYKLPYKGPPMHPPGIYTSNKHQIKPTKEVRLTPKVEPLKLDLLHNDTSMRSPPNRGVKTTPSPSEENILGRPLSLKSPVITTTKKPTSLGEFLKAQDFSAEQDRPLPRTSLSPQIISPSRVSPLTSPLKPMTSPITPTYSTSQSYLTKGYQSPPSRDVTSSSKYSNKSPTTNGSPFIQSYNDVKQPSPRKPQSSADKPTVFGDISCPDFQMDNTSAHHEREVTTDGRTLRNKKADIFGGSTIDLDNSLVQYKGAIGTIPFKDQGKVYYEVDIVYNIQQPLEETWLVFEIGICRLDDVDMHHTVERHEFARSFYVARYPEDGKLTQEFWHNRDLLSFSPLSDNEAGIEVRVTYGFLVDTKRKKWIVADCNNNKVLHSFDMLDFSEALYPVFGCYNPDLCTVEITLKTGSEITMVPQCLKQPGYRSP